TLLYGIWPSADGKTQVYGPFVNRDHMGTWLVLAIPLAVGYLAAGIVRRGSTVDAMDAISLWIGGAVGVAVAAIVGAVLATNRHGARSRKWLLAAAVAAVLVFVSIPVSSQLLAKFDQLKDNATGGG